MTNEEASIIIGNIPINGDGCYSIPEYQKAKAMAIKALETVSCIKEKCAYCPHCENCDVDDETLEIKALEQEPCDDCISRQAVLDQAVDYGSNTYLIPVNSVKTLPSVTLKKETAHWINKTLIYKGETKGERDCYAGTCSACGTVQECWKFCCGCGARMVSE